MSMGTVPYLYKRYHSTLPYVAGHAPHWIPALRHHQDPDLHEVTIESILGRRIHTIDDNGVRESLWSVLAEDLLVAIGVQWGRIAQCPPAVRAPNWSVLAVPMGPGRRKVIMVTNSPRLCRQCPRRWRHD
jgi:hypothetical protein